MLTIRFARTGKKNKSQFQVVVQEHTIAPGGRHVEVLGSYDPHQKKAVLNGERVGYWIGQGVDISDSAYNLFVSQGLIQGAKRKVKMPEKKVEETPAEEVKAETSVEVTAPEAKAEEPKAEEAKEEAKAE